MGRLTDDITRLVGEIQAARDDRGRLMLDLRQATAEVRRAVAELRSGFAADLAGARAAWFGARAAVRAHAWVPESPAAEGWGLAAEREAERRPPAGRGRRRR